MSGKREQISQMQLLNLKSMVIFKVSQNCHVKSEFYSLRLRC